MVNASAVCGPSLPWLAPKLMPRLTSKTAENDRHGSHAQQEHAAPDQLRLTFRPVQSTNRRRAALCGDDIVATATVQDETTKSRREEKHALGMSRVFMPQSRSQLVTAECMASSTASEAMIRIRSVQLGQGAMRTPAMT